MVGKNDSDRPLYSHRSDWGAGLPQCFRVSMVHGFWLGTSRENDNYREFLGRATLLDRWAYLLYPQV